MTDLEKRKAALDAVRRSKCVGAYLHVPVIHMATITKALHTAEANSLEASPPPEALEYFKPPFKYEKQGQTIYCEGLNGLQMALQVRGWGFLVGSGANALPHVKAEQIQDEFGEWVCDAMNAPLTAPKNVPQKTLPEFVADKIADGIMEGGFGGAPGLMDIVGEDDTVQLTYFKPSGKYYSSGAFKVCGDKHIAEVSEVVRALMQQKGLPDLVEGHSDFDVMVEYKGVPALLKAAPQSGAVPRDLVIEKLKEALREETLGLLTKRVKEALALLGGKEG